MATIEMSGSNNKLDNFEDKDSSNQRICYQNELEGQITCSTIA